MGPDGCGALRDVPAGEGVHLPGPVRVRLTGVDRGPSRGVNHQVGPQARHRRQHRVPVSHVELGPVGRDHFVVGFATRQADQVGPELAGGPRDQNPHAAVPAWALSGSHHHRLARYQAKVDSRASPSDRFGSHPSERIFEVSMA